VCAVTRSELPHRLGAVLRRRRSAIAATCAVVLVASLGIGLLISGGPHPLLQVPQDGGGIILGQIRGADDISSVPL
jgi:hypothetical protein